MKFKLISILLAASLLMGCGSNLSKDNSDESDEMIVSEPVIEVLGVEEIADDSADAPENSDEDAADQDSDADIRPFDGNVRVLCWGDSLTEGTGGDGVSYPSVLAELTGFTVKNYGVYAERASLIAARQGGNPQHVSDMPEIPADCTPVKINVIGDNGAWEMWCNNGDAGVNPCVINGVEGTLSIDGNDGSRYFTRNTPGEPVTVNNGDKFTTAAMRDMQEDDILIIWSGSSDGLFDDRDIDDVIAYQKSMLKYAKCDKYIIINYTAKYNIGDAIDSWNDSLEKEYGEHYLDLRSYMLEKSLEDAKIEATPEDISDIESGEMPTSLRVDGSHFNATGYELIARQVYRKMVELGYCEDNFQ